MSPVPLGSSRTLGVDGGATFARVWSVERGACTWRAGEELARVAWPARTEREPAGSRERHGAECVAALARALARAAGGAPIELALCMPGRKTDDRRGIEASNHGPVAPDLLDRLAHELAQLDVRVACAPSRVHGDGLAAAAGERFALGGNLVGARHAYYAGSGTGLGEALVIGGDLVPLDWVEAWFPKAFELRAPGGESFEAELAAAAVARRAGGGAHLEVRRAAREPAALEATARLANALVELIAARCESLARSPLGAIALERVVLGQRFADLVDAGVLAALRAALAARLGVRAPALVVSHLAGAAAVGAHVLEERLRA